MTDTSQNPLKALTLGANGQLARNTTRVLLEQSDAHLTLYLRRANRLQNTNPSRVTIVEGDVLDAAALRKAMQGHDVVYANLAGDMASQARSIIGAMHETGIKRLDGHLQRGAGRNIPEHSRSLPGLPRRLNNLTSAIRSCARAGSIVLLKLTIRSRARASHFAAMTFR
jgi:NAD(P)H-binding